MQLIILQTLIIKILRKFTENVQKEPFNFLTIDTKLKLIKMTVPNQIKILNRKIMQNEAHYHLHRKAAKISALPSNNLDKYV